MENSELKWFLDQTIGLCNDFAAFAEDNHIQEAWIEAFHALLPREKELLAKVLKTSQDNLATYFSSVLQSALLLGKHNEKHFFPFNFISFVKWSFSADYKADLQQLADKQLPAGLELLVDTSSLSHKPIRWLNQGRIEIRGE